MNIIEIKNIIRKDVPIYYRRLYSGTLVVELTGKTIEEAIDFTVETMPTGMNEAIINNMGNIDYPIIPLTKEVKKFIMHMDDHGKLPT